MRQHLFVLVSPPKSDGRGTSVASIIHFDGDSVEFRKAVSIKHGTDFNPDYRTVYGAGLGDDGEFIVTSQENLYKSHKDINILNCVSNKRATQIGKVHMIESTTQMKGLFLYIRALAVMLASTAKGLGLESIHIYSGNALDQAIELHSNAECCEEMSFSSVIESKYMASVWKQALSTIKTFHLYG